MAQSACAPVDYQALFEKSPGFYSILDSELRVVAATDAYCRAIRLPRETMIGRPMLSLFPDHERNPGDGAYAKLEASLNRVLRLKRSDAMDIQRYDLPRPDGSGFEIRYWSPRNSPILDEDGNIRWIVHRVYDITSAIIDPSADESRRRLAQNQERLILELQRSNEELAQLDALRNGLLQMSRLNTMAMMSSALAHDVSQPLTAAKNYLSALRRIRPEGADAKADDLIVKLAQQIDRASDIVKTLRGFMASGSTLHKPENVAEVVGDAARLAEAVVRLAGATLSISVDPDLPPVKMDRVQIQQVILNLVTNAAEAVTGEPVREIAIAARIEGGLLRIDVSDTGCGLPREVEENFREPFGSTKLINMGLGLPISRQIVKEHNGTMWAKPNAPNGTIFSLTIASNTPATPTPEQTSIPA